MPGCSQKRKPISSADVRLEEGEDCWSTAGSGGGEAGRGSCDTITDRSSISASVILSTQSGTIPRRDRSRSTTATPKTPWIHVPPAMVGSALDGVGDDFGSSSGMGVQRQASAFEVGRQSWKKKLGAFGAMVSFAGGVAWKTDFGKKVVGMISSKLKPSGSSKARSYSPVKPATYENKTALEQRKLKEQQPGEHILQYKGEMEKDYHQLRQRTEDLKRLLDTAKMEDPNDRFEEHAEHLLQLPEDKTDNDEDGDSTELEDGDELSPLEEESNSSMLTSLDQKKYQEVKEASLAAISEAEAALNATTISSGREEPSVESAAYDDNDDDNDDDEITDPEFSIMKMRVKRFIKTAEKAKEDGRFANYSLKTKQDYKEFIENVVEENIFEMPSPFKNQTDSEDFWDSFMKMGEAHEDAEQQRMIDDFARFKNGTLESHIEQENMVGMHANVSTVRARFKKDLQKRLATDNKLNLREKVNEVKAREKHMASYEKMTSAQRKEIEHLKRVTGHYETEESREKYFKHLKKAKRKGLPKPDMLQWPPQDELEHPLSYPNYEPALYRPTSAANHKAAFKDYYKGYSPGWNGEDEDEDGDGDEEDSQGEGKAFPGKAPGAASSAAGATTTIAHDADKITSNSSKPLQNPSTMPTEESSASKPTIIPTSSPPSQQPAIPSSPSDPAAHPPPPPPQSSSSSSSSSSAMTLDAALKLEENLARARVAVQEIEENHRRKNMASEEKQKLLQKAANLPRLVQLKGKMNQPQTIEQMFDTYREIETLKSEINREKPGSGDLNIIDDEETDDPEKLKEQEKQRERERRATEALKGNSEEQIKAKNRNRAIAEYERQQYKAQVEASERRRRVLDQREKRDQEAQDKWRQTLPSIVHGHGIPQRLESGGGGGGGGRRGAKGEESDSFQEAGTQSRSSSPRVLSHWSREQQEPPPLEGQRFPPGMTVGEAEAATKMEQEEEGEGRRKKRSSTKDGVMPVNEQGQQDEEMDEQEQGGEMRVAESERERVVRTHEEAGKLARRKRREEANPHSSRMEEGNDDAMEIEPPGASMSSTVTTKGDDQMMQAIEKPSPPQGESMMRKQQMMQQHWGDAPPTQRASRQVIEDFAVWQPFGGGGGGGGRGQQGGASEDGVRDPKSKVRRGAARGRWGEGGGEEASGADTEEDSSHQHPRLSREDYLSFAEDNMEAAIQAQRAAEWAKRVREREANEQRRRVHAENMQKASDLSGGLKDAELMAQSFQQRQQAAAGERINADRSNNNALGRSGGGGDAGFDHREENHHPPLASRGHSRCRRKDANGILGGEYHSESSRSFPPLLLRGGFSESKDDPGGQQAKANADDFPEDVVAGIHHLLEGGEANDETTRRNVPLTGTGQGGYIRDSGDENDRNNGDDCDEEKADREAAAAAAGAGLITMMHKNQKQQQQRGEGGGGDHGDGDETAGGGDGKWKGQENDDDANLEGKQESEVEEEHIVGQFGKYRGMDSRSLDNLQAEIQGWSQQAITDFYSRWNGLYDISPDVIKKAQSMPLKDDDDLSRLITRLMARHKTNFMKDVSSLPTPGVKALLKPVHGDQAYRSVKELLSRCQHDRNIDVNFFINGYRVMAEFGASFYFFLHKAGFLHVATDDEKVIDHRILMAKNTSTALQHLSQADKELDSRFAKMSSVRRYISLEQALQDIEDFSTCVAKNAAYYRLKQPSGTSSSLRREIETIKKKLRAKAEEKEPLTTGDIITGLGRILHRFGDGQARIQRHRLAESMNLATSHSIAPVDYVDTKHGIMAIQSTGEIFCQILQHISPDQIASMLRHLFKSVEVQLSTIETLPPSSSLTPTMRQAGIASVILAPFIIWDAKRSRYVLPTPGQVEDFQTSQDHDVTEHAVMLTKNVPRKELEEAVVNALCDYFPFAKEAHQKENYFQLMEKLNSEYGNAILRRYVREGYFNSFLTTMNLPYPYPLIETHPIVVAIDNSTVDSWVKSASRSRFVPTGPRNRVRRKAISCLKYVAELRKLRGEPERETVTLTLKRAAVEKENESWEEKRDEDKDEDDEEHHSAPGPASASASCKDHKESDSAPPTNTSAAIGSDAGQKVEKRRLSTSPTEHLKSTQRLDEGQDEDDGHQNKQEEDLADLIQLEVPLRPEDAPAYQTTSMGDNILVYEDNNCSVTFLNLNEMDATTHFIRKIHNILTIEGLKHNSSLGTILDLRGSSGHAPGLVHLLTRLFSQPEKKPSVLLAGALRLGHERVARQNSDGGSIANNNKANSTEKSSESSAAGKTHAQLPTMLNKREASSRVAEKEGEAKMREYMMFPPTASVWTEAERQAIQAFESSSKTRKFTPQWGNLRPKDFSQFHYMVSGERKSAEDMLTMNIYAAARASQVSPQDELPILEAILGVFDKDKDGRLSQQEFSTLIRALRNCTEYFCAPHQVRETRQFLKREISLLQDPSEWEDLLDFLGDFDDLNKTAMTTAERTMSIDGLWRLNCELNDGFLHRQLMADKTISVPQGDLNLPYYGKPVALLVDSETTNSGSTLASALRCFPNVFLVGGFDGGGAGPMLTHQLLGSKLEIQFQIGAIFHKSGRLIENAPTMPSTLEMGLDDFNALDKIVRYSAFKIRNLTLNDNLIAH
eukprot:jgi/Bigna1/83065/fgenesh1_pg.101_\